MIDLKAIREKVESLPIESAVETSLGKYSYGSELIIRIWSDEGGIMVAYCIPNYRYGHIFTVYDNEDDNVYESNIPSVEVLERLKKDLSERGINYDNT